MEEKLTLYKLMILYMLKSVKFPLTTSQISEFIVEKGYTNFFKVQQSINELLNSHLIIDDKTYNKTSYYLSLEGKESVKYIGDDLNQMIRDDIDNYIANNKNRLLNEFSTKSYFEQLSDSSFLVHCIVEEDGINQVSLNLTVPKREMAESIANNWQSKNVDIYSYIMKQLL
ncbi:MAG: DUF4364 family protein [Lachnospiraceae bacterium]|jgi:hypothetical protein|nr:DUF4364 family protein [Lachnospiraceae bacterium]